MIDLSKLRAPGWERVIGELSRPTADEAQFLMRLVAVLGQVSGARQGVLFDLGVPVDDEQAEVEPRALFAWPTRPATEGEVRGVEVEYEPDVRAAARSAAGARQTRVYGLEREDQFYDADHRGCVIALPVPSARGAGSAPTKLITLLTEQRSKQALQTTLALCEVLVGYAHAHYAHQDLARTKASGAALDLAARLIASVNQASNFRGACLQLCNDLMRQLGLDRVAIGFVRGVGKSSGKVRAVAMSDTEHLDRRMAMVRKLEDAMDECFDQEQAVMHPPPAGDDRGEEGEPDALLASAIAHAHRDLASADAKLRVASVPLRIDDEVVGVLTVESASGESPLGVRLVEWLQASMDLVAPVLEVRRRDDRNLALRTKDSLVRGGGWLVGPRHTVWKLAMLVVLAVIVTVVFVRVPYRIEAPVELAPRVQRVVSAPFDGVLERLGEGVEKGAPVVAGQVLIHLRTTELELGVQQALTEMAQASTRRDAHINRGELAEAEQAQAEIDAAAARIELLRHRIERATIRAPIDGVIVEGDFKDRIGSTISLGEPMFVVAQLENMVATIKVPDSDIAYIEEGMAGSLATKSRPGDRYALTVDRIVPLARPEEGGNAFEVRATLADPAAWMRPGMEGLVKLETGDRSIAWILSRRIRDTLRMWLWW